MTEALSEDQEPPKRNANENPWYLLATIYGEPTDYDVDLQSKNRKAWNGYMATMLSDEDRDKLIKNDRHLADELKPLTDVEKRAVKENFENKCRELSISVELPKFHLDHRVIDFSNTYFLKGLFFQGFILPFSIIFAGARFSGTAGFSGARFSGVAGFSGARFSGYAEFSDVRFSGYAEFSGARFSGYAEFSGARFSGVAGFINAEMKGETSFKAARFVAPPLFFGAKLHEGTNWYSVQWPDPPMDPDAAEQFVRAYERLKLEMENLKKHDDELKFFALEMRSRRVLLGPWKGFPLALYGFVSDYGRSYVQPLCGLLITVVIGTLLFWFHFGLHKVQYFGIFKFKRPVGVSLANTFGVLGFRSDFIKSDFFEALPGALKFAAAMQTVIGTILIFLFGLAIRNRFRMK